MRTRPAVAVAAALTLTALATLTGGQAGAATRTTTQENWTRLSPAHRAITPTTELAITPTTRAADGRALRLRLPAGAEPGPMQGVGVSSVEEYRYGTFSTRMRSADCRKQKQAGVVTGAFTYANDGQDHDGDGITDNDEIDIEFLCAQPQVVYLTIWTDYSETTGASRSITRTIDLGKRIRNFNSATAFRTYGFDWEPDRVTYFTYDDAGRRITLWDHRGDSTTVPDTAAPFMQNVWHSRNWNPVGFEAHAATTAPVSAFVDSTTIDSTS